MDKGENKLTDHIVLNIFLFFVSLPICLFMVTFAEGKEVTVTVNVGIISENSSEDYEKVVMSCINMSHKTFYEEHSYYSTRLSFHVKPTDKDVVAAASRAIDLIKHEQVKAIIGPPTSMQTNFVKAIGEKAEVPIITFSASDPSLTSVRSPHFFRAAQNDSTQTGAISALMAHFRWRKAVPVYQDDQFGQGILPYLAEALEDVEASIAHRCPIPPKANDSQIEAALSILMNKTTRVFIVHMEMTIGHRVFTIANRLGMMNKGYVWIMTDAMTDFIDSFSSSALQSMKGVLGVRPYVKPNCKLDDFEKRWIAKFRQDNPESSSKKLNIFALWAADTVTALATAVEQAKEHHFLQNSSHPSRNLNELRSIPSVGGSKLVEALGKVNFDGLSGNFTFVDGQLPPAKYQILNAYGNAYRGIGFWTPEGLNLSQFSEIIWPGNNVTSRNPKGWELPTLNKSLRVVVPVKQGNNSFVTINYVNNTKENGRVKNVTGFSIEVFELVLQELRVSGHNFSVEYIPFSHKENGSSAGDYNAMVYQVYLGEYDAAVGDITIVSNRSKYVDFTMPYKVSGVSVVARSSYWRQRDPLFFMDPLTWQLWFTSFCSFIWIGIVVWSLEHRVNNMFSGPPSKQAGNSLWFSFSTMFFAHSEKVVNDMAKIVVVMWCFVILILTQSYTASMTSRLTVEQIAPVTLDLEGLIKSKESVGCLEGSFVIGILKQLKFNESRIKIYKDHKECHELFENKTIIAAVDETPFMRPFIAKYCNQYTEKHAFETGGFGYVFPIESPLRPVMSRAVVKVVTTLYSTGKGGEMPRIEEKWFLSPRDKCSDDGYQLTSTPIELKSFWNLFLFVGGVALLAVLFDVADYFIGNSSEAQVAAGNDDDSQNLVRAANVEMQPFLGPSTTLQRSQTMP